MSAADLPDDGLRLLGKMGDREAWTAVGGCSIGRALDVVGTRSAMLLMREAFYGTTRFDDFARRVGITEAVASARLKELVAEGLLARSPYREPGQRTRHEYRLTDKGRDLLPAALALMQWGDRYLADVPGGPVQLTHGTPDTCGAEVHVEVRCTEGHEVTLDHLTAGFRRRARD
jgi:DNA-binding HxlR family transcriptional regulator